MSSDDAGTDTSPPADVLHHLVDQFVFAPIGALSTMRGDVDGAAERGRQRVEQHLRNARFIGEMVVQQGSKELGRRLREMTGTAPSTEPTPAPSTAQEESNIDPPSSDATTHTAAPIDHLIAGYDDLAASHVVRLLDGFTAQELQELVDYETATRGRRTILNKASQLLSEEA